MSLLATVLDNNHALPSKSIDVINQCEDKVLADLSNDQVFAQAFIDTLKEIIGEEHCKDTKYLATILSNTKDFSKNTIIGNCNLNCKGLHAFRVVFSHYAYARRCVLLNIRPNHPMVQKGIVIQENFFNEQGYKTFLSQIAGAHGTLNKQPNSLAAPLPNDDFCMIKYFALDEAFVSLIAQCCAFEKYQVADLMVQNTFVQRLINTPSDNDEQKDAHSDIFFPAWKFWYFPEEVNIHDGTFCYTKTGPLTGEVLDFHFKESIRACTQNYESWRRRGHREGSLRASEEQIELMGLKLENIEVKPNTLVVANVFNFHCRGDTIQPKTRTTVHGSIRTPNPFGILLK